MKRITYLSALGGLLLALALPTVVYAVGEENEASQVMISGVSPESKQSASEEYVDLYNSGLGAVEVAGWRLQYRSASHTPDDLGGWSTKAIIGCASVKDADCDTDASAVIEAGETLRLSSYGTDASFASPLQPGMATSGGEVRLVQVTLGVDGALVEIVRDLVGYGTARTFENAAAPAPKAGQPIIRASRAAYYDTNNNASDFVLTAAPTVQSEAGSGATTDPGRGAGGGVYLDAAITEVFPDPASPELDSADEFIELYNPYNAPIDLTGYTLATGATWSHIYVISDLVLGAHEYVALSAAQTHVALSNSGTGVRLLDPGQKILFEAPSYGKAVTGASWVQDSNGKWVWTTNPTPGEQNSVVTPTVIAAKVTTTKSKTTKPKASKTASSKKTSTPKKTGAVTSVASAQQPAASSGSSSGANMWFLGAAAAVATGYVLFEYRRDVGTLARRVWQAVKGRLGM